MIQSIRSFYYLGSSATADIVLVGITTDGDIVTKIPYDPLDQTGSVTADYITFNMAQDPPVVLFGFSEVKDARRHIYQYDPTTNFTLEATKNIEYVPENYQVQGNAVVDYTNEILYIQYHDIDGSSQNGYIQSWDVSNYKVANGLGNFSMDQLPGTLDFDPKSTEHESFLIGMGDTKDDVPAVLSIDASKGIVAGEELMEPVRFPLSSYSVSAFDCTNRIVYTIRTPKDMTLGYYLVGYSADNGGETTYAKFQDNDFPWMLEYF